MSVKDSISLASGDTVVFAGDSITNQQMFTHYLIAWLHLTYPQLNLKTYHVGRVGSDLLDWWGQAPPVTAPGVSVYEEYVFPYAPDHVFMMLGQNGGQSAAAHIATYEDLWTDWVSGVSGAQLICMGMHPTQLSTDTDLAEAKADAEATFAAETEGVFASHTFDQIGAAWLANHANGIDIQQANASPFGGGYPEGTANDKTHPGVSGHIAIAWAVLQGLGAETVVSACTINAATLSATVQANCAISSVAGDGNNITFDRLDNALPWSIDEAGRANAIALVPEIEGWQDYSITVTNLAPGTYDIKCDGVQIGTATHTELAAGWNMADLTAGPVFAQVQDVLAKIRLFVGFDPVTGASIGGSGAPGQPDYGTCKNILRYNNIRYITDGLRGAAYASAMASYISQADAKLAAIHTAAQPVTRTYSLTNQTPVSPPVSTGKRSRAHVARILSTQPGTNG